MKQKQIKNRYEILIGIGFCFVLALPAWFLGQSVAIVIGILTTLLFPKLTNHTFTSKKILPYSIILLGFQINFYNVITVGKQSLFIMLFTLSSSFITLLVKLYVYLVIQLP
jgi:uncharacterized membrane protein YadS